MKPLPSLLFCLLSSASMLPLRGEEAVSEPAPVPAKQVPDLAVQDRVAYRAGDHNVTILRGDPSILPDPPAKAASVPVTQEQGEPGASSPAGMGQTRLVAIAATVYDRQVTCLRWKDPETGTPHEVWSRVDFNHLADFRAVDSAAGSYLTCVLVENVETHGQPGEIPPHPLLPAGDSSFIAAGDAVPAGAIAPVEALHDFYKANKESLAAACAERERQAALAPAVPSPPKDNVMWFRPRKGSRYLQQQESPSEGGAR